MQLMFPLEFLVYFDRLRCTSQEKNKEGTFGCAREEKLTRLLRTSEDFMGKGCLG